MWIKVSEKLPEIMTEESSCSDDVLCYWGEGSPYSVAAYDHLKNEWFGAFTLKIEPTDPLYWMPLPEPPKEES